MEEEEGQGYCLTSTDRVRDFDFNNLLLTIVGKGDKQRIVPFLTELRKRLARFGH